MWNDVKDLDGFVIHYCFCADQKFVCAAQLYATSICLEGRKHRQPHVHVKYPWKCVKMQ